MSEKQTSPRFIILQSIENHRYLHLDRGNPSGALRFQGDYSYNLETRFEVVPPKPNTKENQAKPNPERNQQLFHIRSLRNCKFLERTKNFETDWITASAVKTDENLDSPGCTLFQVEFLDQGSDTVILCHKNTGYYVTASYDEAMYSGLKLSDSKTGKHGEFKVLDWQSILMLPDLIQIKGDNGMYLKANGDGSMDYDKGADVPNSTEFEYQVSASRDGGIRLKSVKYGKYWAHHAKSPWILANGDASTESDHPTNTVFIATKLGDNTIVLRNLENGLFCKRFTNVRINCLATLNDHIDEWSPMIIEEPVWSRTIHNIEYQTEDTRIYDEHEAALVSFDAINERQEVTDTVELNLKHTEIHRKQWTSPTHSVKTGVSSSIGFSTPDLPIKIAIGSEHTTERTVMDQMGDIVEEEFTSGHEISVPVPPMTRVKVAYTATRVSYEIPFSYTQTDIMAADASKKVYYKREGLFKGKLAYNYNVTCKEVKLTPKQQ